MASPNRVHAGVPSGGQFAASTHAEANIELTGLCPQCGRSDDCVCEIGLATAPVPQRTARIGSTFTELNDPADVAKAVAYGIDPRLAAHTRRGNEMFDQVLYLATRQAQQGRWNDAQAEIDSMSDSFSKKHKTAQHARVSNARAALAEMRIEASRDADPDVANAALSPRLARSYDRTAFQVKGGACYEMRRLGPDEAADKGCPTATHALLGHHEERLGRVEVATGLLSRVPGWSDRKGLRASFVCDDDPDFDPLPGYIGQ